ncbi:MAG: OadG family protein [Clostridia bacterium]|nr:OadG family protein [Clostridia bacterium]
MTACSFVAEREPIPSEKKADLEKRAEMITTILVSTGQNPEGVAELTTNGPEYVEALLQQAGLTVDGNGMITAMDSWEKALPEIGVPQSIGGYTFSQDNDKEIIVTVNVLCDVRNVDVEIIFENDMNSTMKSAAANVKYTFGEKMEKAGLNTLLGMGTVFCVLILISFIISWFSFIPKIQEKFSKKNKTSAKSNAVDQTIAQIIEKEELSDDLELVAVITAAIAASEEAGGGSADGFVVRSIRRSKTNKWQKA